jgi:formyltetrahydrofolate deformylase
MTYVTKSLKMALAKGFNKTLSDVANWNFTFPWKVSYKKRMEEFCCLIFCRDEKGLIYQVAKIFLEEGVNITENLEFVDHQSSLFFMRTEFAGALEKQRALELLRNALPEGATIEIRKKQPKRLVIYVSDEPHCLGDLLLRHSFGQLNGVISAVISQHEVCRSLCERFDIPFYFVPVEKLSREAHEKKMQEITSQFSPDYLVLARYMRILTSSFVDLYPNRILNIHHSFLPAFVGKNPYEQAFQRGVKIMGATAHFVNHVLDDGPIIKQGVVPIDHSQDPSQMAKMGQDVERLVLAQALDLVLDDRVIVHGRRTIIFQ